MELAKPVVVPGLQGVSTPWIHPTCLFLYPERASPGRRVGGPEEARDGQLARMICPLCDVMGGGGGEREGEWKEKKHRETAAQDPRLGLITFAPALES